MSAPDQLERKIAQLKLGLKTERNNMRQACLTIAELKIRLRMVAKLAADTPQFFNPLVVAHAKKIRDRVLAEEIKP